LESAKKHNAICAVLKDKSPSCSVNFIYNNNALINGHGVTCSLLKKHNFIIFYEEELQSFQNFIRNQR